MKQIFIYMFFFISILGCKKNDESGILHWSTMNNGIPNNMNGTWNSDFVYVIATQVNNVYISIMAHTESGTTFERGVYLLSNPGNSWTAVNNGVPDDIRVNTIAIQGNNIYIGLDSNGVYLSSDYGKTWNAANNGLPDASVWALAIQENNIYAGMWGKGIYLSSDTGKTWKAVNNGLNSYNISSIACQGNNIYAGTDGGGLYFSSNSGSNWTAINDGLPANIGVFTIAVQGNNIYIVVNGNIYLSSDNGNNWTSINNGLTDINKGVSDNKYPPNYNVNTIAVQGNIIYAGTGGSGMYLSNNNGSNWTAINDGLPSNAGVLTIAIHENTIYVGTSHGVYVTHN